MLLPNQCSYASHQRIHQHKSPYTCPECGAICRSVHFQTHVTKNCLHYTRRVGFRSVRPSFPGVWSLCRVLRGLCSAFSFSYKWNLDRQILWEPRSFVGGCLGLTLVHAKPRVKGAPPARHKRACGKAWLWSSVRSLCTFCPRSSRLSLSCCLHFNPVRIQCISAPLSTSLIKTKGWEGPSLFSCVEGWVVSTRPFLPSLTVEEPSTQITFLSSSFSVPGARASPASLLIFTVILSLPPKIFRCLLQHLTNPNISLIMCDDAFELDPPLCDLLKYIPVPSIFWLNGGPPRKHVIATQGLC